MDCLVAGCSGGQQAAAAFSCPRMPCWDMDVVEVRGQAVQGEISHHHVSATDLFCAELKCRTPVFAWIAAFLIFQGEEHSDQLRSLAQLKQAALFFPWTNAAPSSEQACPGGVYLHSALQRDTKGLIWAPPAGSACKQVSPKWLLFIKKEEERAEPCLAQRAVQGEKVSFSFPNAI